MPDQLTPKIQRVCNCLAHNQRLEDNDRFLSLTEFIELYQTLTRQEKSVVHTDIVLLEKFAAVQFTSISQERFVVRHNKRLIKADFERTVVDASISGDTHDYSLFKQLKGESKNSPVILLIFLLVFAAMAWTGLGVANNYEKYLADPNLYPAVGYAIDSIKTVNDLLITCATLFLSIFVIFTVAQNTEMVRDIFLFKQGVVHKLFRDDLFITKTVIFSLLASLLSMIFLANPLSFQIATISIAGQTYLLNKLSLISPLLTAFAAGGLSLCFISILYYQKRTMSNLGAVMAETVLKEAYDQYKPAAGISKEVESNGKL